MNADEKRIWEAQDASPPAPPRVSVGLSLAPTTQAHTVDDALLQVRELALEVVDNSEETELNSATWDDFRQQCALVVSTAQGRMVLGEILTSRRSESVLIENNFNRLAELLAVGLIESHNQGDAASANVFMNMVNTYSKRRADGQDDLSMAQSKKIQTLPLWGKPLFWYGAIAQQLEVEKDKQKEMLDDMRAASSAADMAAIENNMTFGVFVGMVDMMLTFGQSAKNPDGMERDTIKRFVLGLQKDKVITLGPAMYEALINQIDGADAPKPGDELMIERRINGMVVKQRGVVVAITGDDISVKPIGKDLFEEARDEILSLPPDMRPAFSNKQLGKKLEAYFHAFAPEIEAAEIKKLAKKWSCRKEAVDLQPQLAAALQAKYSASLYADESTWASDENDLMEAPSFESSLHRALTPSSSSLSASLDHFMPSMLGGHSEEALQLQQQQQQPSVGSKSADGAIGGAVGGLGFMAGLPLLQNAVFNKSLNEKIGEEKAGNFNISRLSRGRAAGLSSWEFMAGATARNSVTAAQDERLGSTVDRAILGDL